MKCSKCEKECFAVSDNSYNHKAFSNCCHAEIIKEDKIPQMTEKEFRQIAPYINIHSISATHGLSEIDIQDSIRDLKQAGIIKKSELETLVEEAEEILIHNLTQSCEYINFEKQEKILKTIQAFKTKYPDYNK